MKVGFVGLGLMGLPMAQNIVTKGFELGIYNRTAKKGDSLVKLGAKQFNTPANLAANSDVVITCVTGPKDVEGVIFGQNGVEKGAKKGLIVVDMSTIGPQSARNISNRLAKSQIKFLDAPVTGGTTGAQNGTLTIFVGGEKSLFNKLTPLLQTMGTNVLYTGPTGSGQAIKLVNNLIVGETLAALAEGFLLGEAQGLTRAEVAKFLANVPALSGMMKNRLPKMVNDEYSVTFSVNNMSKDLQLALRELKPTTQNLKPDLPLLNKTAQLYKKAIKNKLGELDNSSIVQVLANRD